MQAELEKRLRENIMDIGLDVFPDNDDVSWNIKAITEQKGYICIQARPEPQTVGYPEFKFIVRIDASDNICVPACYALIDGNWRLLCSSPEESKDWKELSW